ncbi:MAG: CBS domain-containing protein [bacterium]
MRSKVKDFMTKKVVTIGRETTIQEMAHIFLTHTFDLLPVVDKENNLLGVIAKKDLLSPFVPEYFDLLEDIGFISDFGGLETVPGTILENLLLAEDIMRENPVTIDEEASCFKALALMASHDIRHLPVVKKGKLIGIVSRTDILKVIFPR